MHHAPRLLLTLLCFSLLAFLLYGAASLAVHAQESGEPVVYSLPQSWQGDATVALDGVAGAAPPLEVTEAVGDFNVSHLPREGASIIRILQAENTPGGYLLLTWPIVVNDDDTVLTPGSVFLLSASARAFSRPDGVKLTIREFDGEEWSGSSVPMQDVQWSDYTVSRQIGENAVEVQVGIEWTLPNASAWLEFSNMELAILPAGDTPQVELSPVDTPTTAATSAPPSPASSEEAGTADSASPEKPTRSGDLVVVTSTPTPPNLFAAATIVAQQTASAVTIGTATATPHNMVTATPTPTPIRVTNTPTPANVATATYYAAYATAMAATTGTPTPLPSDSQVIVVLPTPTQTPKPRSVAAQPTSTATRTSTAIAVDYAQIVFLSPTPTPEFPQELVGKILFLSDHLARNSRSPNAFMINPDGTGLALMNDRHLYDRAKARDAYSEDKRFHAYSLREPLAGSGARIQVYYDDAEYASTQHQMTYFGSGTAWAPAWSPRREEAVVVSNDSDNDELWLVHRNEWPPTQLTDNDWEWDRSPSYSPDGRQIVFESNRITGTRQLWIMDATGQNQRQITNLPFETWEPVWVKYTDD